MYNVHCKLLVVGLPCCKYFVAVWTWVTVIFDPLVYDLDVSVQMTFLTEHFVTLRTGGWLVNLDVEMNLKQSSSLQLYSRRD